MTINMKDRDISLKLEGLIAAQQRLDSGHSLQPVLAAKRGSAEAGIRGEERVAQVFRNHPFSSEHHNFHDLSPAWREKFQIDTFALTPWFATVLEVKNIGGSLEFKDNPPQLIRTREDGHKDGYESPVVQLERNRCLISDWLQSRHIHLPIYGAVVLAYPKQIVAVPPANTKLLFPNLIPSFLKSIPQQHGNKLDHEAFYQLSLDLLKSHQPFIPKPICETYSVPFSDFRARVRCKVCGRFGMIKLPRTWHCPPCGANEHLAHIRTLREWFLIFQTSITNKECREFLGVDIHTAKRILLSMNLQSEGTFRDRRYFMDFNCKQLSQK